MVKALYQDVLRRIKPAPAEQKQMKGTTSLFLKTLNARLKDARAILGGSGAKDTWLAGNHDVDVFVLFDYARYAGRSLELSDLLETALRKAFPKHMVKRVHGSRDYFQLRYQDLSFEVIPIIKISRAGQAKNITDVSPLHSLWVNRHTKRLKDEIRLAKQFLKANALYGAESHIMGFSGYVVEILLAHQGSFEKLLKASQKWKIKEVIDAAGLYPKKDALFHLNQSKTVSPLIVIDPVDKSRNAAAALSLEKFLLFQKKAKEYLARPSVSFFEKKEVTAEGLRKEARQKKVNMVYLEMEPLAGKEDVIGTKLLKAFHFIEGKVKSFGIMQDGWELDKDARVYFLVRKKELPQEEIRAGPPIGLEEHVARFKKEHKDTFVKEGKIFAKVKVEHPQLEDFVKAVLKERYVRERIKRIKRVEVQ